LKIEDCPSRNRNALSFRQSVKGMNLEDLWIGDPVRILSSNLLGSFEGDENGKARIKTNKGTLLVEGNDLVIEKVDAEQNLALLKLEEELREERVKKSDKGLEEYAAFPREFDLHLNRLNYNSSKTDKLPLDFQMGQCNHYLQKAIRFKIPRVIIIHGNGEGVLRAQVLDLISYYEEIVRIDPDFRDGCCVIWFEY